MKASPRLTQPNKEIDGQTLTYWKSLRNNPLFIKLLEHLDSERGEYDPNKSPSQHAHIQSERNGGIKGWDKLASLLLNPPEQTPQ